MRNGVLPFTDGTMTAADAPPDLAPFPEIDVDFETDGVDPRTSTPCGAAVGTPTGTWYVAWGHRGGGNSTDPETASRWLRSLRGKRISNHTTKFEIHMSRRMNADLREGGTTFHDVSHSAALLDDHRKVFNLETLAQDELGEGKIELFSKENLAELPAGAVAGYAKRDVVLVRSLRNTYAPRLGAECLGKVSLLEDALIPAVVEMEANGMPLDMPLLERWEAESKKISEKIAWELYRLCGSTINPDASTDMTRLFIQCKEPIVRTETGAPSFTAPIVQAASERHPAIRLAWRLGKLNDLRNKYLTKYLNEQVNGVLYPSLNQLRSDEGGTISGRFSCVRPNLQQVLGKDKHTRMYGWLQEYTDTDFLIKRLFVPAAGRLFSTDAKQLEYRIFAHYTGSKRLIDAYAADPETNFHKYVREEMLSKARPDITHTETKTANFLYIFGGKEAALSRNLGVTLEVAQEILEAYDRQFPEARTLFNKAMSIANERGYVKTFLGRRSRFPASRGPFHRERIHKALNAVVQGTAADLVKLKMVRLYDERQTLGLTLRMMVHDAFVGDCDDEALPALKEALAVQEVALTVPVLYDSKLGSNWAEAG